MPRCDGKVCVSLTLVLAVSAPCITASGKLDLPNTWVLLRKDNTDARRGGAVRYADADKKFLLWGFMDADPEFAQENPSMPLPEHDVVYFDPEKNQWRDHVLNDWAKRQAEMKPLYFVPRCFAFS